ncbi:MAG: hypothetical protein JRI23_22750, partial [Deltaproteobacteria bacterium]|nr:hypothetical protein [Deltaproteobacteria bacterium]MBW2534788.1 hypothetical protein [Deltaproteobacteria bacterium]
ADCAQPAVDDGCEVTLGSDTDCAACGHDCEGGSCTAGDCSAFSLASDFGTVLSLAVDANNVYWANQQNSTVESVPVGGGGVTLLKPGAGNAWYVTLDGTHVYWANESTNLLGRVPKGGGADDVVVAGHADAVGVNDTTAFYLQDQGLWTTPKAGGGSPVNVASFSVPLDLVVDGDDVFVSDAGLQGIRHYDASTNSAVQLYVLVGNDVPNRIALDASHIFFTGGGNGKVWSGTRDGQTLTEIVALSGNTAGLALSATHVYFTDSFNGEIRRVPKAGGAHELIATGQADAGPIGVDANAVYWARTTGGDIYKKVLAPAP